MYRITTKKAKSQSVNQYTTIHHNYSDELAKYRLELQFIIADPKNVFRQNLSLDEEIDDSTIVEAAEELLESLDKPKNPNPNVEQVSYRGLPCQYNKNTKKYYFGFACGLVKNVHLGTEEPKKPRAYRSDLTKAKYYIRKHTMNWITIMIDENTIVEKLL